jgi:hypothetical protein
MKKVDCKIILIFASICVFPLIIFSPIITRMHHLLLGTGGVFFAVTSFCVSCYGSGQFGSSVCLKAKILIYNQLISHNFRSSNGCARTRARKKEKKSSKSTWETVQCLQQYASRFPSTYSF